MIALEQRRNEDDRSLGELFYYFSDELADITFKESMLIILNTMKECIFAVFKPTEEQMGLFIDMFMGRLPEYIKKYLVQNTLAA